MQIDVAMGTLGRHEQFKRAMDALNRLTNAGSLNIYIMDGNSDNKIDQFIDSQNWEFHSLKLYKDADCIKKDQAGRWPIIYNHLFRQGSGDLLTYWSDDVFPDPDCFRVGAKHFADKSVGAVAFAWRDGEGAAPKIYGTEMHNQVMVNFGLFRRTMFESLGMIDEHYHFYFADQDLSLKFWYAGHKVMREKGAIVTHYAGKKSNNKNRGGDAHAADLNYFRSRWGYEAVKNRRVVFAQPVNLKKTIKPAVVSKRVKRK